MKVKTEKRDKPEVFEPFDLVLTVECRNDLIDLWHRFNLSGEAIKRAYVTTSSPDYEISINHNTSWDVWEILEKELKK